jgi:hypothetical protein
MHPLLGLLILIGLAAFIVFAFRKGLNVRRDDRPDRGAAYGGGADMGGSHHSVTAASGTVNEPAGLWLVLWPVLPINAEACSYAARCRAASAAFIPCGATRARSSAG